MSQQTVRDAEGNRYVLEKRSGDSSRVRDLQTGERRHLPNGELEPIEGEPRLIAAARSQGVTDVGAIDAVPSERALGLLVELDYQGPIDIRTMLSAYDLCESDLHGVLGELQAGGLIEETMVAGIRGYQLTNDGNATLDQLR